MMKFATLFLTLIACGTLSALPLGNPADASLYVQGYLYGCSSRHPCDFWFCWWDAWSVRVGFYGDYVYNRYIQVDPDSNNAFISPDVEKTTLSTTALFLAFNVCDRLDVFGTVGESKFHVQSNGSPFLAGTFQELAFNSKFSWSIGGRWTYTACDRLVFGAETQYFESRPDLTHAIDFATGAQTYFNGDNETHYREWQVGLGLGGCFRSSCHPTAFIPYVGVKWAWVRWGFHDFISPTLNIPDLEAAKTTGYVVGATWVYLDMLGVTVEGRFADEKALYVNSEIRF